ncbi:hypothetical protein [Kitasatospora sp. NPDC093558]|uniref:hypothetical protein n=1 Tax=Kitasatospora sp. NPDC093558 TaxID=3155201 RepID=UPI00341E0E1E
MPPSADSARDAVAAVMLRHDIEEILEVPAVPATGGLRYPRSVRLEPEDEPWYLRSFGTDFTIVPAGWLRRGPSRCYSLGRDLDEEGEREGLLLVQAFTADPAGAEALAEALSRDLAGLAERIEVRTGRAWQRPCCWVAARLPAERGVPSHA